MNNGNDMGLAKLNMVGLTSKKGFKKKQHSYVHFHFRCIFLKFFSMINHLQSWQRECVFQPSPIGGTSDASYWDASASAISGVWGGGEAGWETTPCWNMWDTLTAHIIWYHSMQSIPKLVVPHNIAIYPVINMCIYIYLYKWLLDFFYIVLYLRWPYNSFGYGWKSQIHLGPHADRFSRRDLAMNPWPQHMANRRCTSFCLTKYDMFMSCSNW